MVAVAVFFAALYLIWENYSDFLVSGSEPTKSIQLLNEFESRGAPDFSLKDVNGEMVRLSDMKDKIVILNFWATWCEPCVDEFPSMIKLLKVFNGQVVLVAMSADDNLKDVQYFLKVFKVKMYGQRSLPIKILWEQDRKLAQLYGTEVLPESYIISGGRKLVAKVIGIERWHSEDSINYFKYLISNLKTDKAKE